MNLFQILIIAAAQQALCKQAFDLGTGDRKLLGQKFISSDFQVMRIDNGNWLRTYMTKKVYLKGSIYRHKVRQDMFMVKEACSCRVAGWRASL